MAVVFEKPKALTDAVFHYCPGCTHGIIHRLVAEAIDTLGIEGRTIGIAPVGCSVLAYDYFTCDMVEASHGRAPAVATGVKRSLPDNIVFTYQGDGDLASIGLCETVSAAARGENITVIFVNNAIYGMTGGQMAPTSLPGQITQTSPYGRDVNTCGWPIRICEMLATLEAPAYLERVTVNNVKNVKNAKKSDRKGVPLSGGGQGLLTDRGAVGLSNELGPDAAEGAGVDRREDDPVLSAGCLPRQGGLRDGRSSNRDCGLRRTGIAVLRKGSGLRGPHRGAGAQLAAVLWPGDARRHGELQRHSVGRPGRLADRKHAERAHGYEQPFAR